MAEYVPGKERDTSVADRVRPPRLYKVLLHNDHYTTMDFVVDVLCDVFGKSATEAVRIMLQVHHDGAGVAGVYPAQLAETKVGAVHDRARANGYPLRCSMEPE